MSAMAAIHQAIYTRLDNDAPLAAAGFKVFDEPPDLKYQGSYVVLGEGTEARGPGSHSHRAYEGTETLHIFARGNSTLKARQALELVRAALEGWPLNVAGHDTLLLRYEFSMTMKEPGWRHIPARFRIVTGSPLPVT
jgi:hypothetical protein